MREKEHFYKTIRILVDAYFKGTLLHNDCKIHGIDESDKASAKEMFVKSAN